MIEPTEADIGRRVVYDPRPLLPRAYGTLVGLKGGPFGNWIQVLFDDASGPLNVGSNLHWADQAAPGKDS